MDAKEKAEELYSKYYNRIEHTFNEDVSGFEKDIVKACAMIAVDEIEDAIDFDWMEVQNLESQHRYWQKVKEEIEKL
jgi:hypothetical protein